MATSVGGVCTTEYGGWHYAPGPNGGIIWTSGPCPGIVPPTGDEYGDFPVGKQVKLIATNPLDSSNPTSWGATRVTGSNPSCCLTCKTKAHIGSASTLFFSGVNSPRKWGESGVGAGFINMSNSSGGAEILTGIDLYQGNLAAFSRRSVQIWSIDPDPANNRQGQVLLNTGAFGPGSVVSVGDIDIFYLSDSGVRSLRARDSSNAAVVNDVGTPIDSLVLADILNKTNSLANFSNPSTLNAASNNIANYSNSLLPLDPFKIPTIQPQSFLGKLDRVVL